MEAEKLMMFRNRLTKVFKHTSKLARRAGITCYRVYDHDLPEFPFCIEFYEDHLYVAEYKRRHGMDEEQHDEWMTQALQVIKEVLHVEDAAIFLKLRQRKPGRLGQYQKTGDVQYKFVVYEQGLKFLVNLSDYLDTGLFLDHRTTRQMVRDRVNGKKVLNLFCYTGAFSVYAAAGGATEVWSADLSNTYLSWSKENMHLNGFDDAGKFHYEQVDVLQYLKKLPSNQFDLVVLDPPTFSNSKRMQEFLDIQRDHVQLVNDCLEALKPGGELFFSNNLKSFRLDEDKIQSSFIKDITRLTTPFDFEGKLHRSCFLITK